MSPKTKRFDGVALPPDAPGTGNRYGWWTPRPNVCLVTTPEGAYVGVFEAEHGVRKNCLSFLSDLKDRGFVSEPHVFVATPHERAPGIFDGLPEMQGRKRKAREGEEQSAQGNPYKGQYVDTYAGKPDSPFASGGIPEALIIDKPGEYRINLYKRKVFFAKVDPAKLDELKAMTHVDKPIFDEGNTFPPGITHFMREWVADKQTQERTKIHKTPWQLESNVGIVDTADGHYVAAFAPDPASRSQTEAFLKSLWTNSLAAKAQETNGAFFARVEPGKLEALKAVRNENQPVFGNRNVQEPIDLEIFLDEWSAWQKQSQEEERPLKLPRSAGRGVAA